MRISALPSALTIGAVLAAALCWAPAPASGVGSIVSSFRLSGYGDPYANGIYVGDSYVSVIYCTAGRGHLYRYRLNRYTSTGSFAGTTAYDGWPEAMTSTGAVAFSDIADGRSGSYLVASSRTNGQPSCIVDVGGRGSLVAGGAGLAAALNAAGRGLDARGEYCYTRKVIVT